MTTNKLLCLSILLLVLACNKEEALTDNDSLTNETESVSKKATASTELGFKGNTLQVNAKLVTKETDFDSRAGHTSFAFQNQMWVLGGTTGGNHKNDVWSSKDGASWQPVTEQANFPARYDHASVVFQDKIWVIGGRGANSNGIDEMNDIWSSSNGKDWKLVTDNAPFAKRFWHTLTSYNGCLWLIGGWGNSATETYGDIWRSCDGKNWVQVMTNAPFGKRRGHAAIVYDNKLWVVGGSKGNNSSQPLTNDVWYTTNGYFWTQATKSAAFPVRRSHTLATDGKLMWLTAGYTNEPNHVTLNDLWYSKNGSSWFKTKLSKPFPKRAYHSSVFLKNKLFLINGYDSGILSDVWSFE